MPLPTAPLWRPLQAMAARQGNAPALTWHDPPLPDQPTRAPREHAAPASGLPDAGAAGAAGAAASSTEAGLWAALSWRELAERCDLACAWLQAEGWRAGQRMACLGLNHPAQLVWLLAGARLGLIWVPLNHRLAPAEWAAVLADCGPDLLWHDQAMAEAAQALAERHGLAHRPLGEWPPRAGTMGQAGPGAAAPIDPQATHAGPPAHPVHRKEAAHVSQRAHGPERTADGPDAQRALADVDALEADAPVLLVYTSGTTGQPKGALHSQANLLANMALAAEAQGLSAADRVASVLPLFHVGGLCIQTLPALSVGAQVRLFSRFDAGALLASIARNRPTLTLQVPATLKALSEHPDWPRTDLGSLRAVWAGSSLLPEAPLRAFMARGIPVCNVYGSTETGPFSVALGPAHAASHLGSCGWPAPGVALRLLGPGGQEQPDPLAVGEIALRGPNVVQRYWPDRPACDADGFFHSGDLGQRRTDGSLWVVGRARDMLISGGENIYPAEIESLLQEHPQVLECAVVGQADARWGEVAVALVVWRSDPSAGPISGACAERRAPAPGTGGQHPTVPDSKGLWPPAPPDADWVRALQAHLDLRLARYKWPRHWRQVEALPKTALGKVQKTQLQDWLNGALK